MTDQETWRPVEGDARKPSGKKARAPATAARAIDDAMLPLMARRALAARRAIGRAIPADLIPDPVLDILMAAFLAHDGSRSMTMAELCGSTTVVPAVATRVVKALQQRGYLTAGQERITLTADGLDMVRAAMRNIVEAQAALTREQQEEAAAR